MKIEILKTQVYYINLASQIERNENFISRMKNAGFSKENLIRIEGIKKEGIPQDSVFVGCFHSQLKALRIGLQMNQFPFLILEDDAAINQIPEFIDVPDDSDAVYVGISSWGFSPAHDGNLASNNNLITDRVDNDVVRVFNMLSSHAILYTSKEHVQGLINQLESNLNGIQQVAANSGIKLKYYGNTMLPCDVIMANHQYNNKVYALRKPIFYQDDKHQYCTLFNL